MTLSAGTCSKFRLLILTIFGSALLCYVFVSIVEKWDKPTSFRVRPKRVSDLNSSVDRSLGKTKARNESSALQHEQQWEEEYKRRVDRVRALCEKDEIAMMRKAWRVASNRRFGKKAYCQTHMCPIIVDEKNVLFFCFIPKVASTRVKEFFLNISNTPLNDKAREKPTHLHDFANAVLHRVSPMYYTATTARRFFKIMFVRHPFDRLVSAFRSKAETPRETASYFYENFWDRVMMTLRGSDNVNQTSRLTFPEFVWYLAHTLERNYDPHWAPYWSRCDPCIVDYDFIGKMETADHDFSYAFEKVGLNETSHWWQNAKPHPRSLTLKYFSQLTDEEVLTLYRIYKLDFLLFGYDLDGFLSKNGTTTIKK